MDWVPLDMGSSPCPLGWLGARAVASRTEPGLIQGDSERPPPEAP